MKKSNISNPIALFQKRKKEKSRATTGKLSMPHHISTTELKAGITTGNRLHA
jgi:hypothetical protein